MYGEPMIDHFGINCADWEKSKAFYDKVLGVLGYTRQMDAGVAIGYGTEGKPDFWIADMSAGEAAGPNREIHVAFQAAGPEAVQAFYDAAIEAGAGDVWAIWDIAIAPDMTFAPTVTQVGTGDCPSVSTLTPTMTRAGDPLPEFPAPDPSAQPPREVSPAAAFRGGYTLTKTRRGDPPGEREVTDIGVATNCLRTADRCVTTATIPGEPGKTNAFLGVYEFADGNFVRTMVPLPADCADGRTGTAAETETLALPADATSNPLRELTGELTATFTAVCPGSVVYDVAYALRPA